MNIDQAPTVGAPWDPVYVSEAIDGKPRIFTLKPTEVIRDVRLQLPPALTFGRLYVDVVWRDGSPATDHPIAFAEWQGKRSAFTAGQGQVNRVSLPLAIGRKYEVTANAAFLEFENRKRQSVDFTKDGQVVTIRLDSMPPHSVH